MAHTVDTALHAIGGNLGGASLSGSSGLAGFSDGRIGRLDRWRARFNLKYAEDTAAGDLADAHTFLRYAWEFEISGFITYPLNSNPINTLPQLPFPTTVNFNSGTPATGGGGESNGYSVPSGQVVYIIASFVPDGSYDATNLNSYVPREEASFYAKGGYRDLEVDQGGVDGVARFTATVFCTEAALVEFGGFTGT